MKSERRHELQHNELADWLAKAGAASKPYQNIALAVVILILVAMLGYTWWSRESAATTVQAWDELNTVVESGNLAKLAKVIEDYPNTNVAHMAAVVLADYHLGEGCARLFISKATAQQDLTKAIELYQSVLEQCQLPSLLERATFGLARAKESKGDAEAIKQAEKLYEDVVAKWPNGAYTVAATLRQKDLKRPVTKSLYDKFARFDPKPAFSSEPGEKPPFNLDSLPNDGPAYMPETTFDLKTVDQDKGKEEKKPVDKPKPTDPAKPAAEKKAPEKSGK